MSFGIVFADYMAKTLPVNELYILRNNSILFFTLK